MSIRGPFVRSASLGGSASVPLPTGTPPAPTGLPSPPTPTSSSSYSSDGIQSTNQQNIQSSTSPSSSLTTSGKTSSASISTPFSSSSQSDGTLTNYKGLELNTDTLTSISPSSHSSMSTGGGAPTNGPLSGGRTTTFLSPVSTGGTTPQNGPTTFGPPDSGRATSVSSDASSPSPPSKESGPGSGDLPSIILSSLLPSSIFTSLTIPTLPPSSMLTSLLSSILTSLPSNIPTSLPPPPTRKPSAPSTTSRYSTLPGQETSSQTSSSTTSPIVGNPTTTSSTPSSSVDKPPITSDMNLSTPSPNKQTSSQRSTSPTTFTTSVTTTPRHRTSSKQSTSLLTSPTSGNPKNASPTSSTTSSTDRGGTSSSSSSMHGPATSSKTGSNVQSSHAPQSPSGSSVNTPIPTGDGLTVSSADSPTSSGGPVGKPSSTYLSSLLTGVAENENVMSTTSPIPPIGDTFSSITYTSIGTFTTTTYSSFGSTSVPVTLTLTSTSVIRTTTPVPTSGARSNEAPIIGGIVGGVLALLLLSIAACYLIRRRRRSRAHQQLYRDDSDLTATRSPAEATTMRGNHPYSLTYSPFVGGQGASESRGDLYHAANSFSSSAFPHPSIAGPPHNVSRSLSGSVLHRNFDMESNDGDISSDNESEGRERYFASAQSFYASNDGQSSLSGGIGIAIGSQSSMDLHSYHTAATTLVAGAIVDNDDSPGPSPSAFPIPPVNPFLDGIRVVDLSDFVASRAPQSHQLVSALSEDAALTPVKIRRFSEQQASWAAAVAAASPVDHDAPTPIATRSLNALIEDENDDDPSSKDLQTPTQSRPPVTPLNDSYFIINPLLRETFQEGFGDDSGDSDSHENVSIIYPYPFESRDKSKGKEYLSADLGNDLKNNRLSNASSDLVFPENPSQCGLAL